MGGRTTHMGFTPSHMGLPIRGCLLSMVAEFRWLPPSISSQGRPHRTPTPLVLGMVPSHSYALCFAQTISHLMF